MSEMPRHVEVFFGEHRAWAGELSGPQDDYAMLTQFRESFESQKPSDYHARDLAVGDLIRLDHRTTYRVADHGFEFVKRGEERKLIADAAEYLKAIFKDSARLAVLLID